MSHVHVLHPGCLDLAWDGSLVASGLGHLWRLVDGAWVPLPPRPLHAIHHRGPRRAVHAVGAYLYTASPSGWRATASLDGDTPLPHPSGAVAFARDGVVHRIALPGRSPRPIPELLRSSLRFGPDGHTVLGLGADGGLSIHLPTGRIDAVPGVPLGLDCWLDDGNVTVEGNRHASGFVEASPAVGPTHLAGPGGRTWCLADAHPGTAAHVALGATAPLAGGFVTAPYDAPTVRILAADGTLLHEQDLGLDPDDLVTRFVAHDGSVWAETALGRSVRVGDHHGAPLHGSHLAGPVTTPLGTLPTAVRVHHEGTTYVADESGWLLSWSGPPSATPSINANS